MTAVDGQETNKEKLDHMGKVRYEIEVPSTVRDRYLGQRTIVLQFVYSLCGLFLGLVCTLGGIVFLCQGVAGNSSWTAKLLGLELLKCKY